MSSLSDPAEVLYRQIHPNFYEDGALASAAFKPFPKDNGMLSVDRSSLTSPAESFDLYCSSWQSKAVYGLSVGEFGGQQISCKADPIAETDSAHANPAHALADFSSKNQSQLKIVAKRLKQMALARGKLHPIDPTPTIPVSTA